MTKYGVYISIMSLCATLNETLTAKKIGILPGTSKVRPKIQNLNR